MHARSTTYTARGAGQQTHIVDYYVSNDRTSARKLTEELGPHQQQQQLLVQQQQQRNNSSTQQ